MLEVCELRQIGLQRAARETLRRRIEECRRRRRGDRPACIRAHPRLQTCEHFATFGKLPRGIGTRLQQQARYTTGAANSSSGERRDGNDLLAIESPALSWSPTLMCGSTCASMENLNDLPSAPRVVGAKKCTAVRCPDCSSGASRPGASSANPITRKRRAFQTDLAQIRAYPATPATRASIRITLEIEVSFRNHARSAGGVDAARTTPGRPEPAAAAALVRAATSSLSSRMEPADAAPTGSEQILTATVAPMPAPIRRLSFARPS